MASKAKQVGKGDIRRMMKETKSKINSPLAKYNSAGQLTCILCNTIVKNELVWPAHANGKLHKDNVANLKSASTIQPPPGGKRKHENGVSSSTAAKSSSAKSSSANSSSSSLPADFFEGPSAPKAPKMEKLKIVPLSERKPAGILKNKKPDPPAPPASKTTKLNAPPSVNCVPTDKSTSSPASSSTSSSTSSSASFSKVDSSSLPADFYDSKLEAKSDSKSKSHESDSAEKTNGKDKSQSPPAGSGEIPDGFFDDPVEDAKVHHKAYVDPLDAQWELFQKEIKMEAHKSEVIEEEDDDVMIYERALADVDDQLEKWARVEALHVKKGTKFIKTEIKDEVKQEGGEGGGGGGDDILPTDEKLKSTANGGLSGIEQTIKIEPMEGLEEEVKREEYSDDDDDDDDSDDDDSDFGDSLDWRSKGT